MPRGKKAAPEEEVKPVRRHNESGAIEPRNRGRRHPAYEYGYLDASGEFQAGDPPVRRRRRRRRRRGRGRPAGARIQRVSGAARSVSGLSEIEQIVAREVETRLKRAKTAALEAFTRAIGV